ncbi:MAG: hypothetical protein M1839_002012 [Geoglossum umbratile]|nr:MAG: hypothetical protein M1839_002012 [Geoglossum umbratile]
MTRDMTLRQEDSQLEPVDSSAQTDSSLTNLPPELWLLILSELELDELVALVRASPAFYIDYRRTRKSTLTKCLELTIGNVAVDACAVFRSSTDQFPDPQGYNEVTQFLHSYKEQHTSAHNSHPIEHLAKAQVVRMATFYFSIIAPLARHYVNWALTNLSKMTKGSLDNGLLSKAEETRVHRALYRFQLYCNLFGAGRFIASRPAIRSWHSFESIDILREFICIYEPWEVEEIACIYDFAKEKFNQIFNDIRWDLNKHNLNFKGQGPDTLGGEFHFNIELITESLLEGTISRGLDLLHMVFSRASDHAQLVSVMQAQIVLPPGDFLGDGVWLQITQRELWRQPFSHRQQKQLRRDPLLFTGDGDSETDGPRPPLAWTVMWGGFYSNMFGEYVKDVICKWGYVIWDATWLRHTGAKRLLVQQLKE